MTFSKSIAALLCTVALAACEKNAVQDITGTLPNSGIRFFNFGVNAPSVNFYANERKVTAVLSATGVEAVTGVSYGQVSSGGFYAAIDPAQYTFTGKIAATVDKDLTVSSVSTTLADGKGYSYYISGFYDPVAKTVESFVVEDNFSPTFDFSVANVRFVNAISNSQPMTLYAKNTTTLTEVPVGAAIAYKGAGTFTAVPGGIYDIATRVGTSATNVISRTAVTFIPGRTYTISARGDITVVSTTAVNRPQLDNTPNR